MALHIPTYLHSGYPHSGPANLVHRLPVSSRTLLGRLERLVHAGRSRVRVETRLRRRRTFAPFAVAMTVVEIRHHPAAG